MCGFLGEYCFKGNAITDEVTFKNLLKLSKHRGPDFSETLLGVNYQLGFNRLAILDLTAQGNQPKKSPSGRYAVVFNGEIYNYKLLQKTYKLQNLKSSSDTEILIHLLDVLGVKKTIKLLNGMFAIAIVDTATNMLFLTRDFAGIKPLFYGISENGIAFASQFNQVYKHLWFKGKKQLQSEIVKEYFGLGYMQAPNTVFKNIYQVNPGQLISINTIGIIEKEDIITFSKKPKKTKSREDNVTAKLLNSKLSQVVERQLVSDVSVASFLSGGIDSPLVTAHAKINKSDIHALSLKVDDKTINESEQATVYANHLKVKQDLVEISKQDLLKTVETHFEYYPEPFGDYSSIPTFAITKKAKEKHDVMLSGDGGDELFWGYPRMLGVLKSAYWFKIPFFPRRVIMKIWHKIRPINIWGPFYYKTLGDLVIAKQLQIFPTDLNRMFPNVSFSDALRKMFYTTSKSSSDILKFLRWNEFYGHLQRVLIKVDRASMGNSVEVRVPLLDKDMIDLAWDIDPQLGSSHNTLKKVLKDALEMHIPKKLMSVDKRGFTIPIDAWLKNELREDVEHVILKTPLFGNEIVNEVAVRRYVEDYYSGKHQSSWGVWHIYAWQKWATKHVLST